MKYYAYCRVSTANQRLQRQIANITKAFPNIDKFFSEKYTGTTTDRPQWKNLLKTVKAGDTIVFDSVSRMSRDAAEGIRQYEELYNKGVSLVFLNEPHINTDAYKEAMQKAENIQTDTTGDEIGNFAMEFVQKVMMILARKQITLAFEQAEKERNDIAERVKQGKAVTKMKRLADPENPAYKYNKGEKLETKKAQSAKEVILKHSRDFGGTLTDKECWTLAGISRNSYYKYKSELKADQ